MRSLSYTALSNGEGAGSNGVSNKRTNAQQAKVSITARLLF